MKRETLIFTTILVLLQSCCSSLWAEPTTAYQAEKVVAGWLKTTAEPLGTALGREVTNVETFTDDADEPIYHIVYLDPSGFVIVPADDFVEPIIGFVETGSYDPSPENPLGALVAGDLNARIAAVRDGPTLQATGATKMALGSQAKWQQLESLADRVGILGLGLANISDVRVPPLVQSKWGQTTCCTNPALACYNYYTPPSDPCDQNDVVIIPSPNSPFPYGSLGNYPCGCVATAMAQLMRYHMYPNFALGKQGPFPVGGDNYPTAWTRGGNGLGGAI